MKMRILEDTIVYLVTILFLSVISLSLMIRLNKNFEKSYHPDTNWRNFKVSNEQQGAPTVLHANIFEHNKKEKKIVWVLGLIFFSFSKWFKIGNQSSRISTTKYEME
tara:strand:- start:182 stop:502 length:321 start_codon:yes stop_codon:yes gene_type:complete